MDPPLNALAVRRAFAERLADEALSDYRLTSLTRWIEGLDDESAVQAIELVEIGLDSSRKNRHNVFWVLDQHMRRTTLSHATCTLFLRWVVRTGTPPAKCKKVLDALAGAPTDEARQTMLAELEAEQVAAPLLANAHAILAHAYRAAPRAAWPVRAVHLGEPEPFIGAKGAVLIAIFIARELESLLETRADKKAYRALLRMAEESVAAGKPTDELLANVDEASREGVMSLARSACAEARAALRRPDTAGGAARPAAVKAVSLLLAERPDDNMKLGEDLTRRFLERLDDELRRLDVVHALTTRDRTSSRPIASAVFRAGEQTRSSGLATRGKGTLWLGLLEPAPKHGPTLGLLAKQGRYWTWTEGSPQDVLALVPDTYFEAAAMAASQAISPSK